MLVSYMTAVCLRGVCRCCPRLSVQVIANKHYKTGTQFERGLTNVITFHSYQYCCIIFSYFRISFRITKERGNLVRQRL